MYRYEYPNKGMKFEHGMIDKAKRKQALVIGISTYDKVL